MNPAALQQLLAGAGAGGAGAGGFGGAGMGGFPPGFFAPAVPQPTDTRPPEERFQVQLEVRTRSVAAVVVVDHAG